MEHKAYEAVKAQHERIIAINGDGAMPRDYGQNFNAIAQLLKDYEALRKERDGYKAALKYVRQTVGNVDAAVDDPDDIDQILELVYSAADKALKSQPAASEAAPEWTPRDKQDVRVIDTGHSMHGKVGAIVRRNDTNTWFWIDFDPSDYDGKEVYQLRLDQIEPVD